MSVSITPKTYGNVVIGQSPSSPSAVYVSNGTGTTWANPVSNKAGVTAKGQLSVEGPDADIIINKQSLSVWMQAVEKRLSILQPKPELHEKYSALEEAYNHYKTLEALLYDDQKPNN